MPRYDYYCDDNDRTVEVVHPIATRLQHWGELCEAANIEPGKTDLESPYPKDHHDGSYGQYANW